MKKILLLLVLLAGCTGNQQRRIAEIWAPFEKTHNLKIIQESLARPATQFSLHLIPADAEKSAYLLKAHLPPNERFLFAAIDGTNGAIDFRFEFESLADGRLKIFKLSGPRYEDALPVQVDKELLIGKQVDYVLVHKKSCSSAVATFLPYPLEAKGTHGERLSLLVTHPMLTRFRLEASGFTPHESLRLIHRFGEKVEISSLEADENGSLIDEPLSPLIFGRLGGEASLTLIGKNGSIDLEYPWGGKLENQTSRKRGLLPILFVANQLPHEVDKDPFMNRFFCSN